MKHIGQDIHDLSTIATGNRTFAISLAVVACCMITARPLRAQNGWTLNSNTVYTTSTDYNVGIGTTSPATKLDVRTTHGNGIFLVESSAPWNWLKLLLSSSGSNSLDGAYSILLRPDGNNSWTYIDTGVGIDIKAASSTIATKNAFRIRTDYTGTPQTLFTVMGSGNVGVGTTAPSQTLHVVASGGSGNVAGRFDVSNTGTIGNGSSLMLRNSNNTVNNVTGVMGYNTAGAAVAGIEFINVNHGAPGTRQGALSLFTIDTGDAVSRLYMTKEGNVGIGTTVPPYKLSVKGTVGAKELIVTNTDGWPDYVFKPGYRVKPLREVDAYVKQHGHLPGIPSEKEVREKGVSVGEMQAKLLAKVEELTLLMIQAEERNNRLEKRCQELRREIAVIRNESLELRQGRHPQPLHDKSDQE